MIGFSGLCWTLGCPGTVNSGPSLNLLMMYVVRQLIRSRAPSVVQALALVDFHLCIRYNLCPGVHEAPRLAAIFFFFTYFHDLKGSER